MTDWEDIELKKMEQGEAWDFKEEGEGAEFKGIYLGKEEGVGPNESSLYEFKDSEGKIRSIWGNTLLDTRFKNLQRGELVKIVYHGLKDSEKRKGSKYHDFDVYHSGEPVLEKVEEGREARKEQIEENSEETVGLEDLPF